jgi:lipid II:glycine glycyltransferase (peptidoglycan interpeptide bridge formation enzyme)
MSKGGNPAGSKQVDTQSKQQHSAADQRQSAVVSTGIPGLRLHRITGPEEWDRQVLGAGGSLLQSGRWGEFKKQAGWSPVRLLLTDSSSGNGGGPGAPAIGVQVLFRKMPRLPVPISIGYVPRGPVHFSEGPGRENLEQALWRAVSAEARKRGAIFLKVEPNVAIDSAAAKSELDARMARRGFRPSGRLQPARTMVLDIGQSEDDLLKAMKPKTRYNIRLAGRRGVQVRRAATESDLKTFYSLLEVTGTRDEFGVHSFAYYEHLWRVFGPRGDNSSLLLLADHPDEAEREAGPVAALLALKFGREAIYMYGASADRGREHMPNYLLQWEAIKWAKQEGCTAYDFWGIPDPPGEEGEESEVSPINARSGLRGVYWFKKGFGGREVDYPGAYDRIYNSLLYKVWMRWRGANLG